jgi:hypothetical protein
MTYTNKNREVQGDKIFVEPHPNGWAVGYKNKSPVCYSYESKENAINTAETLAKKNHADLVIQKSDGSIEKNLSFR